MLILRAKIALNAFFALSDICFLDNGWIHDFSETLDFVVRFYRFMFKEISFDT